MLIEQIVDLELREPVPNGRTCTPTTAFFFFYYKTKIFNEYLRMNYFIIYC